MGHPPGQKEAGRAKVLESAGKGFRKRGYGGLGIDAIAKEAGVTSGAFYAHFKSKADAFRASVATGMNELRSGVEQFKAQFGASWKQQFVQFYLTDRRTCDIECSCALQSLSAEVARSGDETRLVFETELQNILSQFNLQNDAHQALDRQQAIALLAILSGGVTLARAVKDPGFSEEIAAAVKEAVEKLGVK